MASRHNDEIDIAHQNQPLKPSFAQKASGFGQFIYNSETGEVLGRSGVGWVKLLIFYFIFYGCLAGFFAMMLSIFFINISVTVPKYYNNDGLITDHARTIATPGMGLRPLPDFETTLITFQANKPETYKIYTDHMQAFLKSYQTVYAREDIRRKTCVKGSGPDDVQGCQFQPELKLGTCGKIDSQAALGYDLGLPCAILKLNKIFGWEPEPITCSGPEGPCDGLDEKQTKWFREVGRPGVALNDLFDGQNVPATCEGINPADKENILSIRWEPNDSHGSFPSYYYPYLNQRGYLAPLVGAQFNVTRGVLIMVRCRAWAKNIKNDDFISKEGAIHFELMVD